MSVGGVVVAVRGLILTERDWSHTGSWRREELSGPARRDNTPLSSRAEVF